MLVGILLAALLLAPPPTDPPGVGVNGGSSDRPPAAVLGGGRSVSVRDANGGIQRLTTIPGTSAFARYAGGPAATCSFTADRDDFLLSDGTRVARGTLVTSHYLFVEGVAVAFDLPPRVLPADVTDIESSGPLESGTRTFTVFCDRAFYEVNRIDIVEVPLTDPLLDPRTQLTRLRNLLQLQRPVVFENPIVDEFGGLVTRYPSWLAIEPDAWITQRGNTLIYRGATLLLVAQPREMDFVVDFVPNPDEPSTPFRGIVSCVPDELAVAGDGALPAFPVLPDQTEPGVNGPCTWTPPGPGRVTITARITYTITFWVNGFTAPDDDYVWTSLETTYDTGELIAVNTKP